MTREELREWLDRKPPPSRRRSDGMFCIVDGVEQCEHDEPSEFDDAREADPQMEAGHA